GLLLLLAGAAWGAEGDCQGEDALAWIAKTQGKVQVLPAEGFRKEQAKPCRALAEGDMVLTGEEATAVVAFDEASKVAMDGGTKLEIIDPEEVRQEGGKAYYRLQEGSTRGRQVRTEFSVIGVKGTEFLVSDTETAGALAMAEGEVEVTAPEGEFKLYEEKQAEAFDAYKQRQQEGIEAQREAFQQYKEQVRREFVEYAESFSLGSGKMATFADGEATTGKVSEELEKDMQRLRDLL
ncbi:MAG: FecR domain-containing protein, partial [Thiohalorhabdaceae bacterium]